MSFSSINRVTLMGNLGADPEIRTFSNGSKVANMRLATTERYKDREGNYQDKTEWHQITVYTKPLVELIEKNLRKGHKVYLEGKMETRKWQDKDSGKDRYTTEVVLRPYNGEIRFIEKRETRGVAGEIEDRNYNTEQTSSRAVAARDQKRIQSREDSKSRDEWSRGRNDEYLDDEIPF